MPLLWLRVLTTAALFYVWQAKADAAAVAAKAAHEAAVARRAALQRQQEEAAAQQNAAWVHAYAEQLEEEEDEENDQDAWEEKIEPVPEERLAELRLTFAELKSCATAAKQDGQTEKQKQLGRHISALAEEIGFIERRHVLMPGWDEPDALSDAQKVLERLSRQASAETADDCEEEEEYVGLFGNDEEDYDDDDDDDDGGEGGEVDQASRVDSTGDASIKSQNDGDAEDGDGFSMFDEPEESDDRTAVQNSNLTPRFTGRARVEATLQELGREGWTGNTPKIALQQWVQKKYRVPVKYSMTDGVASVAMLIKGVRQAYEQPSNVSYDHKNDAQNAAALVALFDLTAAEALPLYRAFPPYFRELWLSWEADKIDEKRAADELADRGMNSCISRLIERAEAVSTGQHEKVSADESLTWEHWHDEETRKQPAARRARGSSVGAVAQIDPTESRRLLDRHRRVQSDSTYQKHLRTRETLPMWEAQAELVATVRGAQVVLVVGETGSGKSTQVPQFILDEHIADGHGSECNIICTQPRRIAAMSLAQRIAAERSETCGVPGSLVGYHIRLEAAAAPSTRLMLCTTGILLRRMQSDPLLTGVSHIIIDEVHERDVNIDFLLLLLRDVLSTRSNSTAASDMHGAAALVPLRVIVMSASFNVDLLRGYFGGACCPVVKVSGRTFPVQEHFLEDVFEMTGVTLEEDSRYAKRRSSTRHSAKVKVSSSGGNQHVMTVDWDDRETHVQPDAEGNEAREMYADYSANTQVSMALVDENRINYELMVDLLSIIAEGNEEGAVLVFLPGLREIQTLVEELLRSPIIGDEQRCRVLALHSSLSPQDQQRVFEKTPRGCRKVVVATNIAETSITIDDVVFVIDAGKAKINKYDPAKRMQSLVECWVSQASVKQRTGRAGRVKAGHCFRFFSRNRHRGMDKFEVPEMLRTPLEGLVLQIKTLRLPGAISEVFNRALEPPSEPSVAAAVSTLLEIGAIEEDEELTPLGYHLAALPVDVRLGKMLLYGALFKCVDPIVMTAATISYKSPFVAPMDQREAADAARRAFGTSSSDHLTTLNAISAWRKIRHEHGRNFERQWCRKHFLSLETLQTIEDMASQFSRQLYDIGFLPEHSRSQSRAERGSANAGVRFTGANKHSGNQRVVAAVLTAGLYPNVARVHRAAGTGKLTFTTGAAGQQEVHIHPRSINHNATGLEADWLVFHDKVKSTRVYLHDSTLITPYPLLLFGGAVTVNHATRRASLHGLGVEFVVAPRTAVVFKELRRHMDTMLTALIGKGVRGRRGSTTTGGGDPRRKAEDEEEDEEEALIELIVHLLGTEFS